MATGEAGASKGTIKAQRVADIAQENKKQQEQSSSTCNSGKKNCIIN